MAYEAQGVASLVRLKVVSYSFLEDSQSYSSIGTVVLGRLPKRSLLWVP